MKLDFNATLPQKLGEPLCAKQPKHTEPIPKIQKNTSIYKTSTINNIATLKGKPTAKKRSQTNHKLRVPRFT